MPVRLIESKHNPRLKELRRALAAAGHIAGSQPGGTAGIEGPNLLAEAMRAGLRVATIFVAKDSERLLEDLNIPPDIEVLRVPRELLNSVLATESPQPVAALVEPQHWSWNNLLCQPQKKTLIVILAGLQDPGNLGTILRSAEAFGATGVVSLPGTVGAWNPKAVRASAGSVFRMPQLAAEVDECFMRLRESYTRIFTTAVRAAKDADLVNLAGPVAFLIGNEGNGVPAEIAGKADAAITIPCPGPVESLNAAAAAAVLLYESARQRRSVQ